MWNPFKRSSTTDAAIPADEVVLHQPVDNAEQGMVLLAKAFVLDQQRREAEARRAARFKRWMVGLVIVGSVGLYAVLGAKALLPVPGVVAKEPAVALVKVEGQISATAKLASADKVVAALKRAFEDANVQRVLLYIDSPGGAPVEAERIMDAVAELRKKHPKPIQAVIGNLGASAGYMVALSADDIVSAKYSLVGSIGAILQSWDVHRVLEKYDVKAKTYASGKLKGMLNPFEPSTPEGEAKAQALVDELGRQFETLLKERRGKKLTQAPDTYATGEVWGGQDALGLGLVDSNGTIETIMATYPDLKLVNFGPFERKNNLLPSWLQTLDDISDSLKTGVALLQGKPN
jgi:signal peptide peptidase SppA